MNLKAASSGRTLKLIQHFARPGLHLSVLRKRLFISGPIRVEMRGGEGNSYKDGFFPPYFMKLNSSNHLRISITNSNGTFFSTLSSFCVIDISPRVNGVRFNLDT